MVRLLPLLFFIGLCFWLAAFVSRVPRGDRTYRPQRRWPDWFGTPSKSTGQGTVHIVRRSELAGLRDAYSSAPIDVGQQLVRCGNCLSVYHADSFAVLRRENGGSCVICRSTDLGPVRLADA
jgi:hypothetical protein